MKVQNIRPYQGNDGSDKWEITFEKDGRPLITSTQPDFEIGTIIPPAELEIRKSYKGAFFVWKNEARKESREKDNAIRGQTAVKIISEIYCAGLLPDFETSEDAFVINLRGWVNAALIKDPLIGEILNNARNSES